MRTAALVSTLLLLNLSAPLSSLDAAPKREILVAAAADLQPLERPLADGFGRASGGATARFTFGASGSLTQQIQNGAPYDVFLSANELFIKQLSESGHLLKDTVKVYALGRVALWSKGGRIRSLADLLQPSVLHVAIANPVHAPYGVAARDALRHEGLWDKLAAKIVYGENVQQTFQYAESGNADAAITAWSVVYGKGGILLPAEWHSPIRQAGGVVAGSKQSELARGFMAFLTGDSGHAILKQFGFDWPKK